MQLLGYHSPTSFRLSIKHISHNLLPILDKSLITFPLLVLTQFLLENIYLISYLYGSIISTIFSAYSLIENVKTDNSKYWLAKFKKCLVPGLILR